jgi:predicted XRE-type DNA-binding protein
LLISDEESSVETGGFIDFEESDRKFLALFNCQEDKERLFDAQMPEFDYQKMVKMMAHRQKHILQSLKVTQNEISALKGKISILEL